MELGLSLGDSSKPFAFLPKNRELTPTTTNNTSRGFCMTLGINSNGRREQEKAQERSHHDSSEDDDRTSEETIKAHTEDGVDQMVYLSPPVQLDLLPLAPVPRLTPSNQQIFPWSSDNGSSDGCSSENVGLPAARGFDVNRMPAAAEEMSSPNSVASSFQMDFSLFRARNLGKRREAEPFGNDMVDAERASSRASDDDENGLNSRKKLRLSKEQSAYLEETFKEHNTLNPKQKLALAKQLNLRPRQVEVWFQNRRARTKLKQTEVDCEYLKRCCETLTEENRRLHKELQELRALKASNPFYMQLPATTLTMCPSCERVATTSTAPHNPTTTTTTTKTATDSTPKPPLSPSLGPGSTHSPTPPQLIHTNLQPRK
ncbi:unnamed protein product [Ilex paraguariensis]|uniref:Homeobox domain-containing protein n=1 Tax=Ilex paraguariensis TaxID=185542 RepID=A0ABC8UL00_9AQUA